MSERDGRAHGYGSGSAQPCCVLGDRGQIGGVEQVVCDDRELGRSQQVAQRLAPEADICVHHPVGVGVPVRRHTNAARCRVLCG